MKCECNDSSFRTVCGTLELTTITPAVHTAVCTGGARCNYTQQIYVAGHPCDKSAVMLQ